MVRIGQENISEQCIRCIHQVLNSRKESTAMVGSGGLSVRVDLQMECTYIDLPTNIECQNVQPYSPTELSLSHGATPLPARNFVLVTKPR